MLQNPGPRERLRSRRWSLAAACGMLSLAIVAAGVTLKATAAPAPEPKEEPKKAEAPALPPAIPDMFLPPNLDPEQAKLIRKQMEMSREMMKRMMEMQRRNGVGLALPLNPAFPGGQPPQDVRLGAEVETPSDTLVEQLDLPRDQGLILREVTADSAAAKAGLKAHDILLELGGKVVPSDPEEFRKALEGIKADTPVDAVVLRKGKKETVKGLSLPEAKAAVPGFPGFNPPLNPQIQAPFPIINFPQQILPQLPVNPIMPGANGVMTTTFRTNDHFTTRHQEGSLIITLTGKVADGKATVKEISVQDGAESNRYDSLDKVAEKYRDKVKNLIEMAEKGSVQVEIKAP